MIQNWGGHSSRGHWVWSSGDVRVCPRNGYFQGKLLTRSHLPGAWTYWQLQEQTNKKAKATPIDQVLKLDVSNTKLFGNSFRKHVLGTDKAKKESKEVHRKQQLEYFDSQNNSRLKKGFHRKQKCQLKDQF